MLKVEKVQMGEVHLFRATIERVDTEVEVCCWFSLPVDSFSFFSGWAAFRCVCCFLFLGCAVSVLSLVCLAGFSLCSRAIARVVR